MSGEKPTEYCVQAAGDANWRQTVKWGQSHYFVQTMKLKQSKKLVKKTCVKSVSLSEIYSFIMPWW